MVLTFGHVPAWVGSRYGYGVGYGVSFGHGCGSGHAEWSFLMDDGAGSGDPFSEFDGSLYHSHGLAIGDHKGGGRCAQACEPYGYGNDSYGRHGPSGCGWSERD